jgi:hypothetical protein
MSNLAGVYEVQLGGVVNVYVDLYYIYLSGASGPRMDRVVHTRSLTNTNDRATCRPTLYTWNTTMCEEPLCSLGLAEPSLIYPT